MLDDDIALLGVGILEEHFVLLLLVILQDEVVNSFFLFFLDEYLVFGLDVLEYLALGVSDIEDVADDSYGDGEDVVDDFVELEDELVGVAVPVLECFVATACEEVVCFVDCPDGGDCFSVGLDGLLAVSEVHAPDFDGLVLAGADEQVGVGGESEREDWEGVAVELEVEAVGVGVEELYVVVVHGHCVVESAGDDFHGVEVFLHVDGLGVEHLEGLGLAVEEELPELDPAILACAEDDESLPPSMI